MIKKIALVGIMGHGKSSVGNLLLGEEKFRTFNDVEHCILKIESQKNDDLEIFDTKGLGDIKIDANSLQNLINTLKNEKINAIFIVYNGTNCRLENSIFIIIKSICKSFIGKYIWKQIGLIFTHYGYDEDTQADVRETGNRIMKKILETAENEYKEIIKNQNQNNKTCDPNEKIIKYLNCFYVNSKKKRDGQYDLHSLEEIEKIKNFVENLMPIDKVQSKFIVSKKLLKFKKVIYQKN
jgi:hypothetical protein